MRYRSMLEILRREEASRRLAAETLKICPLCGAVNSATASDCFVCSWRGEFSFDPEEVEDGVVELLAHCPELVDAFVPLEPPRLTLLQRVRRYFERRRVQRKLDYWA